VAGWGGPHARIPYNAEYATRTAKYLLRQPLATRDKATLIEAKKLLDDAILIDPSLMPDLVARAQLELRPQVDEVAAALHDYQRALALDPANLRLRVEYANALKGLADKTHNSSYAGDAYREFWRALDKNEEYHWDEPKRLSAEELAAVRKSLAELEGPQSSQTRPADPIGPGPRDRGR
jgi:tetratricopeptide (TPR) repeat protein